MMTRSYSLSFESAVYESIHYKARLPALGRKQPIREAMAVLGR